MTRSRGWRGGRRGNMDRVEQVSRALSRTLRHSAREEKLHMREDGYVNVQELLDSKKYQDLGLDFPTLCQVVRENNKKRFKLIRECPIDATTPPLLSSISASTLTDPTTQISSTTEDSMPIYDDDPDPDLSQYFIRATQGHSIPIQDSLLLQPINEENLPSICVHGTYYSALSLILDSGGLRKMTRTHIHCAAGLPRASIHPETGEEIPAVLSGMRFDAEALFYIDVRKAVQDGLKFWRSDNGVILTTGNEEDGCLPMEYIFRVEDVGGRAGGGDLWSRDEGVVKEWPTSGRGKGGRSQAYGQGGRGGRNRRDRGSPRTKPSIENELEDTL